MHAPLTRPALLERETFSDYRLGWSEAFSNLVQYRIVIAAMVPTLVRHSRTLTAAAVPHLTEPAVSISDNEYQ